MTDDVLADYPLRVIIDRRTPPKELLGELDRVLPGELQPGTPTDATTVEIGAAYLQDLCHRLESLPVIEQAKGILMGAYRIDADRAFATLVRWSQSSNVKVRDLARVLVEGQTSTQLEPAALVRAVTAPRTRQATSRIVADHTIELDGSATRT